MVRCDVRPDDMPHRSIGLLVEQRANGLVTSILAPPVDSKWSRRISRAVGSLFCLDKGGRRQVSNTTGTGLDPVVVVVLAMTSS